MKNHLAYRKLREGLFARPFLKIFAVLLVSCSIFVFRAENLSAALLRSSDVPDHSPERGDRQAYFYALSDFVNRSPGERGETNSTKGGKDFGLPSSNFRPSEGGAPSQRALGKIFEPELPSPDLAGVAEDFALPVFDQAASPQAFLSDPALAGTDVAPASDSGSLAQNPVFSPLPIIVAAGDSPSDTTPPALAVPEPGTWFLLIIGFFMAGLALRVNRQQGKLVSRRS